MAKKKTRKRIEEQQPMNTDTPFMVENVSIRKYLPQ